MNGELHLLQELTQPEGVPTEEATNVAVSASDGKIAVSYERKVVIFAMVYYLDDNGKRRSKWKLSGSIDHESAVNSISWHPSGLPTL